jgi:hypothetical protein
MKTTANAIADDLLADLRSEKIAKICRDEISLAIAGDQE